MRLAEVGRVQRQHEMRRDPRRGKQDVHAMTKQALAAQPLLAAPTETSGAWDMRLQGQCRPLSFVPPLSFPPC